MARATLNVVETGTTVRSTAGAHARDAEFGAAVGVHHAIARLCDTAGAVITCLAGGARPADPTAAVLAAVMRGTAVRRAAGSADTGLAQSTRRNTGAAHCVAVFAWAAGSSHTDRTTDLIRRAARSAA
jgi:hypothetical protein